MSTPSYFHCRERHVSIKFGNQGLKLHLALYESRNRIVRETTTDLKNNPTKKLGRRTENDTSGVKKKEKVLNENGNSRG